MLNGSTSETKTFKNAQGKAPQAAETKFAYVGQMHQLWADEAPP